MDKMQLMLEADRRGLLPPDQKVLLDEAVKRGIVGGLEQPKQFGEQVNSIPRQVGLTVRGAMQGPAELVTALTEPIRLPMSAGLRMAGLRDKPIPNASQMVDSAADFVGLPQPSTPNERIANDAVRTMGGAAATMGAGTAINALGAATPTVRELIRQFTSNAGTQIAGAAGAGGAGGYTRETGGNPLSQFLASVAGGVGAGTAVNMGGRMIDAAKNAITNFRKPQQAGIELDAVIQRQLGDSVDVATLPFNVKAQLRTDIAEAMKTGNLSTDAVKRLADYRMAGAMPNRAGLTQDPIDITQQRNTAKFGANSKDKSVQTLARMENENAKVLGSGVQEMAGGVVSDRFVNSERALGALKAVDDARGANVSQLYEKARDSLGRAAPLDPATATKNAGLALAEKQAGGLLPAKAQSYLNDIATGKIPFNVDTKEQIVRNLGSMARGASPDEAFAIGLVRKALDDAPLLETHGLGPDALKAFREARTAHAQRMQAREASPAIAAAADDFQPDQFFSQYVLSNDKGSVRSLSNMKKELGETSGGFNAIRGEIVAYLKEKGGINETSGKFTQSGFNNALKSLGDKKLSVFFTPDELAKLKAIGRVADYEQGQVRGSAVNNSNTGATVASLMEKLAESSTIKNLPLIGRIPESIALRVRANQAQNVPSAIAMPSPVSAADGPILSPALVGLLAAPQEDKKNKRAKALLE